MGAAVPHRASNFNEGDPVTPHTEAAPRHEDEWPLPRLCCGLELNSRWRCHPDQQPLTALCTAPPHTAPPHTAPPHLTLPHTAPPHPTLPHSALSRCSLVPCSTIRYPTLWHPTWLHPTLAHPTQPYPTSPWPLVPTPPSPFPHPHLLSPTTSGLLPHTSHTEAAPHEDKWPLSMQDSG